MTTQISRLVPGTTVCWEDRHTLRFGFERARARVHRPSPPVQRLVASLRRGFPTAALPQEAKRVGATLHEARELLTVLRPVLLSDEMNHAHGHGPNGPPRTPPVLGLVDDGGRTAPGLREQLTASGLILLDDRESAIRKPQLVILVERFLEPLSRARRWSFEDVPQLLIRFTDDSVRIGPIFRPSGAPCHACLSLDMVARDPAYPALAAQLHGETPASETAVGAGIAAAYAAALIDCWRDDRAEVHTTRLVVPAAITALGAAPRVERVEKSRRCGCDTLDLAGFAPPLPEAGQMLR